MVEEKVKKVLVEQFGLSSVEAVNLDEPLSTFEGDSLDLVEIVMSLKDELEIEISDDAMFALGNDFTKITGRSVVGLVPTSLAERNAGKANL